jgi:hypothetical protein
MNIIAIDWSGAADGASKTWLAEVDTSTNCVLRLEAGRSRVALADHLIAEAKRNPQMIVGFDFAFSLPVWFTRARGITSAPALWELVASEGEAWLANCEPPFWGRPGKQRPEMEEHFRRTDAEVPSTGGMTIP